MTKELVMLAYATYIFWVALKIHPTEKHPNAILAAGILYMVSWAMAIASFIFFVTGIK